MIKLIRTNSENQDFIDLVKLLDADLAVRDGDDHPFYDQFNKIDSIIYVLVAYENDIPLGCGALKEFSPKELEIKRMFTLPESRGKGIASLIMGELEKWAAELKYEKCILETGIKQPEAIALYEKLGYSRMTNYGQYSGVENSLCLEKKI
jgi:GNAT superfamily N-acetyltransferase